MLIDENQRLNQLVEEKQRVIDNEGFVEKDKDAIELLKDNLLMAVDEVLDEGGEFDNCLGNPFCS